MVAAYLREIGIDYLLVPPRDEERTEARKAPAVREGETLEDIRMEALACRRCALCAGRSNVVFGVGNPRASLMFVGEGPGMEEVLDRVERGEISVDDAVELLGS